MRSRVVVSRLLINRSFGLLWSGQTVSYLGDAVFTTTLILWIATRIAPGQSWAPLAVSGVLVAASGATLLVGPLAGVFVDRWDKRRTLLGMDALRGCLIALLLPLAFLPQTTLPVPWELGIIYAVVILTAACDQFFGPARLALIGDIVPEEQRPHAISAEQASQHLTSIIGPPLAAPLLFTFGVQWALLIDALSFGTSFLAILAIAPPPPAASVTSESPGSVLEEFRTGLRFFIANRVLMTLLIALFVSMLGAGATNALNIFFLQQNLHAPARLYGVLGAAFAVGSLGGAVLAGLLAKRVGLARCFWLGLLLVGLLFLVYARMNAFLPGVLAFTAESVPNAAISVVLAPLVLAVTPRKLVGRIFAVLMPGLTLTGMISMVLAGFLASTTLRGFHAQLLGVDLGPVDTIFMASAGLMMLVGLYAMVALRLSKPTADPVAIIDTATSAL